MSSILGSNASLPSRVAWLMNITAVSAGEIFLLKEFTTPSTIIAASIGSSTTGLGRPTSDTLGSFFGSPNERVQPGGSFG